MTDIVLYGADWCGDCRRAKTWLRENNIPFTEVDVEHDEAARDKAIELADGRKNIPVVVFPNGTILIEPTNADLAAAIKP
ncbi:glutathione S-transferase N-terminal domain-containing protein [Nocardia sp. NBC_01503]|uniref:glutaredoxin family protein n=1 Tax=Nocardia sp. NBC_01503 TaxID=2975997 RepID=UPI002E7AD678|nr:glutaredoxin domain-containing protein [Nocardia sp. NBC_01503]WTL34297.1 glutathione S-transferase N-terminal domain-containing protein [Nocardia sp. NBC_01503]